MCLLLAEEVPVGLIYVFERVAAVALAGAAWWAIARYRLFDVRLALSLRPARPGGPDDDAEP